MMWETLVVLAEDEFVDRATLSGGKLPVIEATDSAGTFPDWATQWAWAHVHVNGTLGGDPNDHAQALAACHFLDAELASPALKSEAAGKAASLVSAHPAVRAALLDRQRAFAAQPGGAVLDGRDRRRAGQTAPPEGLCFVGVDYPEPLGWRFG